MSVIEPIAVWTFDTAPPEWKALSDHGGDEDWLAFVPADFPHQRPLWLETLGFCSVSEHAVPGGRVYIGAHS